MIALGRDKASVELRQFGVEFGQSISEQLEFFATTTFDERTTNQVIDDLLPRPAAHGTHETGNPPTGMGLTKGDPAFLEQIENKLEMLQFLDGDLVQCIDLRVKIAVLFKIQRRGGRLAFQMGV